MRASDSPDGIFADRREYRESGGKVKLKSEGELQILRVGIGTKKGGSVEGTTFFQAKFFKSSQADRLCLKREFRDIRGVCKIQE